MRIALPLAHGLSSVQDLPVPLWLFYYGAAVVLIVSFVALGALWRRPLLQQRAHGRPLGPRAQRILMSPEVRLVFGLVSFALLAVVFLAGLVGEASPAANITPTFVYVLFWLGLVPLVVLLGNVWRVLNPWRAGADGVAWLAEQARFSWEPPLTYPAWLGRIPAGVLLSAYAALELAWPDAADPRDLAIAIAIYSIVTWFGMLLFGRRAWLENGEAFSVYFELLSRVGPFAVEERRVVVRPPLSGLSGREERPGTVFFVAVMLGSVAFDGFSRTPWWQDRVLSIEARWALESPGVATWAVFLLNLLGLVATIALVALVFLLAVEVARVAGGARRSLASDFVGGLVPIALAYAVAHYFSFFVIQGQVARRLVSDPFGYGWDLFGTADFQPRLDILTPNMTWYVQVAALVAGHVFGLALAHDRAVALFGGARHALRTQYAMLVLMVAYTVGGLYLLSAG